MDGKGDYLLEDMDSQFTPVENGQNNNLYNPINKKWFKESLKLRKKIFPVYVFILTKGVKHPVT
jgi:hypothetical protein